MEKTEDGFWNVDFCKENNLICALSSQGFLHLFDLNTKELLE